jgi:hypothetical protein
VLLDNEPHTAGSGSIAKHCCKRDHALNAQKHCHAALLERSPA